MWLTLPAVRIASSSLETEFGRVVVPGHTIPEKRVEIDPQRVKQLLSAARQAAEQAYAPYSRFRVGTAVVMADDPAAAIYPGSNVENGSYGATVCAERTGLFHCAALGFRRLRYLAVSTLDALDRPLAERAPCGVCRQVIKEFSGQRIAGQRITLDDALILIDNGAAGTLCEVFDIERLLPYGFNFAGPGQG